MGFDGKRFLLPKRYVSSSDFLTPQRHLNVSTYKQLLGQPPGDATVYNPHDFNQKRYDPTMWKKYKDELGALGYVTVDRLILVVVYITHPESKKKKTYICYLYCFLFIFKISNIDIP